MGKKIVITKNGYEILKIVEWGSDKLNCDFKIIPMIDVKDINVFYMKLFSKVEYFEFDKTRDLEFTYHKATLRQPTKIHLKLTNKEDKNDIKYGIHSPTLKVNIVLTQGISAQILFLLHQSQTY